MQIHVLYIPVMDQMSTPIVSHVTGGQRTVIRHILDMASTSTASTMRIECIIFYVDPKSVGSFNFLGKERVRFPIIDEHLSLAVFKNGNVTTRGQNDL